MTLLLDVLKVYLSMPGYAWRFLSDLITGDEVYYTRDEALFGLMFLPWVIYVDIVSYRKLPFLKKNNDPRRTTQILVAIAGDQTDRASLLRIAAVTMGFWVFPFFCILIVIALF